MISCLQAVRLRENALYSERVTLQMFIRGFNESGRLELIAGFRVELEPRIDSEKFDDLMSSCRKAKRKCTM